MSDPEWWRCHPSAGAGGRGSERRFVGGRAGAGGPGVVLRPRRRAAPAASAALAGAALTAGEAATLAAALATAGPRVDPAAVAAAGLTAAPAASTGGLGDLCGRVAQARPHLVDVDLE